MFANLQKYLPQHLISKLVGMFASSKLWLIKNLFIIGFMKYYQIDLSEAKISNPEKFTSFNDFFTRELKEGAREIDTNIDVMVSPADGTVSDFGQLRDGMLIQAKEHEYSYQTLLTDRCNSLKEFSDSKFATVYLAPNDYHRVHMPVDGKVEQVIYVPGRLLSVNQSSTKAVPDLFAKNERVITIFNTDFGKVAVVMIGAMIVGNIEISWIGNVNADHHHKIKSWNYTNEHFVFLKKGEELGKFMLGSTVVMLFPDKLNLKVMEGQKIKFGQKIAEPLKKITES